MLCASNRGSLNNFSALRLSALFTDSTTTSVNTKLAFGNFFIKESSMFLTLTGVANRLFN